MPPTFLTPEWTTPHIDVWNRCLAPLKGIPNLRFLEIGSWDGCSACWFLENILTEESSTLTCIDPFPVISGEWIKQFMNHDNALAGLPDQIDLEKHFDANIRSIGATSRVIKHKGRSQEVLRGLRWDSYDVIYVDGSHYPHRVLEDAILSWPLLKIHGLLVFDDYELAASYGVGAPKAGIDAFFSVFGEFCTPLHKEWQVIVRKKDHALQPESGHPATGATNTVTLQTPLAARSSAT